MATPRLMGAEVKRKEDPRLITGTSSYVGDLALPGMHYVAFVRSPHAHARVRGIDAAQALRHPGVFKVVTGSDIRKLCAPLPLPGAGEGGGGDASANTGRKHYPLSVDRVRHVGEAVAAVIATSEEVAVDAAADVVVDWEPLPAVTDPFRAMAKGAPQIHDDAPGNIEHQNTIKAGDPDGVFVKAKRVVKQRMVSQRLCGVPLEGRATLAAPDPTSGGLIVWATNQAPHGLRNDLATALGMPQNLIRVIAPEVGGGFGVKFGCYPEDATLAALAKLYRMPLRWTETRVEHMMATTHGRAQVTDLEVAGYAKLRAEQKERVQRQDRKLLGIGMSCYVEMCGFGPFESAVVRVEPGGTVTAYTGTSAHGQGHETSFSQILSDHLGVPFDKIVVRHGDTLNTPMGNGTGGSRSLVVGGSAILGAALKVQAKARRLAAHMLEAAEADIVLNDGRYQVKGVPDKALTLDAIAARAYGEGLPDGIESGLESTEFFRPPNLVYPFGAHVAVVEADRETGRITVRDFISVDDCGVRISPILVAGQVHGGLAQGIAQALLEELVYGADRPLVTGSLMDYALPHADDLPSFHTDQTVTPTPRNPMGAKGIGEAATIGATPAIVNAVVDALRPFGVRHLDMPLRPERVWQALKGR